MVIITITRTTTATIAVVRSVAPSLLLGESILVLPFFLLDADLFVSLIDSCAFGKAVSPREKCWLPSTIQDYSLPNIIFQTALEIVVTAQ